MEKKKIEIQVKDFQWLNKIFRKKEKLLISWLLICNDNVK